MESAAKKMKVEGGAAIIGQSGGPTVVINRSLVGWITAAKKEGKITKVLGMRHGIKGLLAEHIVDLGAETEENLANVAATPAAALGSVRMKPTKEDFAAMIPVLQKFNIKYFFYIGGNDSAETAHIVNESAKEQGYAMKCFHIPKTIDNDLRVTDHCPGYASAARFVAHGFQGDDRDLRAMGGCKINICMGRDAGWLTAAATLGRRDGCDDGPHLVYLPEANFDPDEFIASVDACMKRLGRCLVAVSEGIHDDKGELFLAAFAKKSGSKIAGMKDSHGNVSLGGTGVLGDALAGLVKEKLGNIRVRADTFGFLQRGFPADTSTVDAEEAAMVGAKAVEAAVGAEFDSGSCCIRRLTESPYTSEAFVAPLKSVAKVTKEFPVEWLNGVNDVGPQFRDYCLPLTGGIAPMADLAMVVAEGATAKPAHA